MALLLALALAPLLLLHSWTTTAAPDWSPPPGPRSPRLPPSPRPPRPPPIPPPALTLQGRLVLKESSVRSIWVLAPASAPTPAPPSLTTSAPASPGSAISLTTPFVSSYKLPGQPLDGSGQPVAPQTSVSLRCILAADDPLSCSQVGELVVMASAPPPPPAAGQSLRQLVLVINLTASATSACAARPGASVSAVQSAYLSSNGYADYLGNCSYGKTVYDRSRLTVVGVSVPCSAAVLRCDEEAIAAAAKRAAAAAGVDPGPFTHTSYVLPTGLTPACGWWGLGELPGLQTWFTADSLGIFRKGTVLQHMLHNFGLRDAQRGDGVEAVAGDTSSPMGFGNSCPSGPELRLLGWAVPLDSLNATSLPPGLFRRYVLAAIAVAPDRAVLRVQPDWLQEAAGGYSKNVYLALRVRVAGDRDLLADFDKRISIHELDRDLDLDPNDLNDKDTSYIDSSIHTSISGPVVFLSNSSGTLSSSSLPPLGDDPRVTLLGTISSYSARDLPAYKLYVRTEGLVSSSMALRICRYTAGPSECGDSGPPQSFLPLPPPSPSPPPPSPSPPPPSPSPPPPSPSPPPPSPSPPPPSPSPPPPSPSPPPLSPSPPTPISTPPPEKPSPPSSPSLPKTSPPLPPPSLPPPSVRRPPPALPRRPPAVKAPPSPRPTPPPPPMRAPLRRKPPPPTPSPPDDYDYFYAPPPYAAFAPPPYA